MRVDFYQLADPGQLAATVASLADKVLASGQRLLVVTGDEAGSARLDRMLWEEGGAAGFLPHGLAGSIDASRQPVLIGATVDAANQARVLLIADGQWRESARHFDRTLYLFDEGALGAARAAWRALGPSGDAGESGAERHYWAFADGRWSRKA